MVYVLIFGEQNLYNEYDKIKRDSLLYLLSCLLVERAYRRHPDNSRHRQGRKASSSNIFQPRKGKISLHNNNCDDGVHHSCICLWDSKMVLIVLLLGALVLIFIISYKMLRSTKVPKSVYASTVIYNDHKERLVRPLFSPRYGLVGKPDFILHTKDGLLPLEIKSAERPKAPYFSHVMQLISYCLLMEEERGVRPKYGFLQYHGGGPFSITYTENQRSFLINTIDDMKRHVDSGSGSLLAHSRVCRISK